MTPASLQATRNETEGGGHTIMVEKEIDHQAYKYRIYPTNRQKQYIEMCIRSCWWFYRYVLHNREDDYKSAKAEYAREILSWYTGNRAYHPYWMGLPPKENKQPPIAHEFYPRGVPLRHRGKGEWTTYTLLKIVRKKYPFMEEIPAVVLQNVLDRVDSAFQNFFRSGTGYPKYPKERNYRSIVWTGGSDSIRLDESSGRIRLSKFPGSLKVVYHRPITGSVKRAIISKDGLGQYYVSLVCEYDSEQTPTEPERVVGIDMNIKAIDESSRSFIALSDGSKINIPRFYSLIGDKLAKVQKKQAKCERGSAEYHKFARIVSHIYEDRNNKQDNWLNVLTYDLSSKYDFVVLEDMNLAKFHEKRDKPGEAANMELAADRGSRKAWTEAPFGKFRQQLTYKMKNRVILVDPKNTSKMCNSCGQLNESLSLSDREWTCSKCGVHHDRDTNAAINILNRGKFELNNRDKQHAGASPAHGIRTGSSVLPKDR